MDGEGSMDTHMEELVGGMDRLSMASSAFVGMNQLIEKGEQLLAAHHEATHHNAHLCQCCTVFSSYIGMLKVTIEQKEGRVRKVRREEGQQEEA